MQYKFAGTADCGNLRLHKEEFVSIGKTMTGQMQEGRNEIQWIKK